MYFVFLFLFISSSVLGTILLKDYLESGEILDSSGDRDDFLFRLSFISFAVSLTSILSLIYLCLSKSRSPVRIFNDERYDILNTSPYQV